MEIFREILDVGKLSILHEGKTKDGNTMTVLSKFADTKKNSNGRTYPARILKREVERVQKQIEAGGFWGTAEHPKTGNQTVTGASHIIQKMWFDEKAGEAWASLKIIPTAKGKDVMTLIKQGAQLGLSTRGTGSVSKDGTIQDDYKMLGCDIVGSPSSQGARFNQSNIFESVDFEEREENKMTKKTDNEIVIEAVNAVHDGKFDTIEEALRRAGAGDLADEYEASKYHIDPKDVAAEALQAGIDPATYAKMLNANLKEQQEVKRTGWSRKERQNILQEAQQAGCDIATHEARQKILDEYVVVEHKDEDTLFEEEVVARHKMLTETGDDSTLEDVRKVLKRGREKKEAEELKQARIQSMIRESLLAGPAKKF